MITVKDARERSSRAAVKHYQRDARRARRLVNRDIRRAAARGETRLTIRSRYGAYCDFQFSDQVMNAVMDELRGMGYKVSYPVISFVDYWSGDISWDSEESE